MKKTTKTLIGYSLVTLIYTLQANADDNLLAQEQANKSDNTVANVQNKKARVATMVQEYKLTQNLVKNITAESADSGAWSDPKTWKDGIVPKDGDRILIHANHRVVINNELSQHYRTIKLEGELAFNPHKNTALYVDTLLTEPGSVLRIGEPRNPIDADKRAKLIISDYNHEGMITNDVDSPDYDPLRIGQGILTNGLFLAHGAEKTPYLAISGEGITKDSDTITLEEEPEGWRVGDKIVVLGTSISGKESEERTITDIDGDTITINEPLKYDHLTPKTTIQDNRIQVHVANISRNIIIESDPEVLAAAEGEEEVFVKDFSHYRKIPKSKYFVKDKNHYHTEHRGHVLFMHNNNVNLNYVEFKNLGRTYKKYHLDETIFDDDNAIYIGKNQAARYAVHFHRAGLDGKVGRINGCVVDGSPGWGYVNHSSNVIMKENIAYKVYGSSFITEAGDENGVFQGNMAIATRGYGESNIKGWSKREKFFGDGGFQGHGFWIIGPYVDFVDNIVNGSSNAAFALKRLPIDKVTGVIRNKDFKKKKYKYVGLKSFTGNIAYGNSGGVFGISLGTRDRSTERIYGLLAWNNDGMQNQQHSAKELISFWYPDRVKLYHLTLIGDIYNPQDVVGVGTQLKLRQTKLKYIKIEGFKVGLMIPVYYGPNKIKNAYLNNVVNMLYHAGTTNHGANTKIYGNIEYGKLPIDVNQTKIKFELKVRDVSWKNYWARQFLNYNITYYPNGMPKIKLYMTKEQSPDYVVKIGSPTTKGKTNAQLVAEGHKPVGGRLLPENAISMPGMVNVSGVLLD